MSEYAPRVMWKSNAPLQQQHCPVCFQFELYNTDETATEQVIHGDQFQKLRKWMKAAS